MFATKDMTFKDTTRFHTNCYLLSATSQQNKDQMEVDDYI